MKKSLYIIPIILIIIVWATTFIFVIQPIGAVPEGKTIWIFKPDRLFTQKIIPFICSPDGFLLDTVGHVSLFGRLGAMGAILNSGSIIIRLPYSRSLYLISTGGQEFNS
jgi:hypothetical protein